MTDQFDRFLKFNVMLGKLVIIIYGFATACAVLFEINFNSFGKIDISYASRMLDFKISNTTCNFTSGSELIREVESFADTASFRVVFKYNETAPMFYMIADNGYTFGDFVLDYGHNEKECAIMSGIKCRNDELCITGGVLRINCYHSKQYTGYRTIERFYEMLKGTTFDMLKDFGFSKMNGFITNMEEGNVSFMNKPSDDFDNFRSASKANVERFFLKKFSPRITFRRKDGLVRVG